MTKTQNYVELLAIASAANRTDLVDFINHEIELITKKNTAPKKPTAKQIQNESIKDDILAVLASGKATATQLAETLIAKYPEITPQRVTACLKQLQEDNAVVRLVEKRTPFFELA